MVAWGDFDNDGDKDVLLSGDENTNLRSTIYENRGGDEFTEVNTVLEGCKYSIISWMDYDNDNDLDILIAGNNGYGDTTIIYRNNIVAPNTLPQSPTGLNVISSAGYSEFSWSPSTDSETPSTGLNYNMFIKDINGSFVLSPDADTITGYHRVAKRGSILGTTIKYLLTRGSYTYGVQAIDASFAGGLFSKSMLTIDNNSPTQPNPVYPESGATVFSDSLYLKWSSEDIDGDAVSYDVWFGIPGNLTLLADDTTIDSLLVEGLLSGTEYQWFIEVKDELGAVTTGDTWNFMVANTETESNNSFASANCTDNGTGFYGAVGNGTDATDYFCVSYPYNGLLSVTVQNLNILGVTNGGLNNVNIYNYQYTQINYIDNSHLDAGETATSSVILLNANEIYYIKIEPEIIDDNVPYRVTFEVDTITKPPDDVFEPNNTMETAYPLCHDSIYSVVGYNKDMEDWYAVSFNGTGTFTIRVSDPNDSYTIYLWDGEGLGNIYIYSESGSQITSISYTQVRNGSTGETSPIGVSAGQTYYIKIPSYTISTAAAYTLKIVSDVQETCVGWKPTIPEPVNIANGEKGVFPGDTTLIWLSTHPGGEDITYDLYLGETNPPVLVATGLTQPEWDVNNIELNDTIYWKVIAYAGGENTTSVVYWFTSRLYSETDISLPEGYHSIIDWGDYDNDNDLDLLFSGNNKSRIYRNDGEGKFVETDVGLVNIDGRGGADSIMIMMEIWIFF